MCAVSVEVGTGRQGGAQGAGRVCIITLTVNTPDPIQATTVNKMRGVKSGTILNPTGVSHPTFVAPRFRVYQVRAKAA